MKNQHANMVSTDIVSGNKSVVLDKAVHSSAFVTEPEPEVLESPPLFKEPFLAVYGICRAHIDTFGNLLQKTLR